MQLGLLFSRVDKPRKRNNRQSLPRNQAQQQANEAIHQAQRSLQESASAQADARAATVQAKDALTIATRAQKDAQSAQSAENRAAFSASSEQKAAAAFRLTEHSQLGGLVEAMKAAQQLSQYPEGLYPTVTPITALQQILDGMQEKNSFSDSSQSVATCVRFSPDGKFIATASSDGFVRIRDLHGNLVKEWQVVKDVQFKLSFSADGKRLATASQDGAVKLWSLDQDMKGSHLETELKNEGWAVNNVSFSSDGQHLVTAAVNVISIWDLRDLSKDQRPKAKIRGSLGMV